VSVVRWLGTFSVMSGGSGSSDCGLNYPASASAVGVVLELSKRAGPTPKAPRTILMN
jgi:hypothetical protein